MYNIRFASGSNWLLLCVSRPQQEVQKIFKAKHPMDIDVTKAKVRNLFFARNHQNLHLSQYKLLHFTTFTCRKLYTHHHHHHQLCIYYVALVCLYTSLWQISALRWISVDHLGFHLSSALCANEQVVHSYSTDRPMCICVYEEEMFEIFGLSFWSSHLRLVNMMFVSNGLVSVIIIYIFMFWTVADLRFWCRSSWWGGSKPWKLCRSWSHPQQELSGGLSPETGA